MHASGVEWERLDLVHGLDRQRTIQVWEERAAARGLPTQGVRVRQSLRAHAQEHQVTCVREVLAQRFSQLMRRGEVNEAIAKVDLAAEIDPRSLRLLPSRC